MKEKGVKEIIFNFLYGFVHRISRYLWPNNDKKYLELVYYLHTRDRLDFEHPKDFTQKMQCLKLYNTSHLCTLMADKYEVRNIVKEKINDGEDLLIPLLGVWNSFDEIDFDKLPDQFVLKTTHDSGGVIICHNKNELDYGKVRKLLNKKLKRNYFWTGREHQYKDIKPRIIAETLMVDESGIELKDYKFFCFDGKPKVLFYASGRFLNQQTYFDYYDVDTRKRLPFSSKGHPHSDVDVINVPNYDRMVEIATQLSKGFPFLRIDLYNIQGKIYFGEFTFHHDGGFVPFIPEEWNIKLGNLINLPNNEKS